MREVNNNTATNKVNNVNYTPQKSEHVEKVMPETKEVTDLGKMPSEVIGRSQVAQSGAILHNPGKIEDLNRFCDYLTSCGYTYEQACAIAGAAADEFQLK